jgi:hypothetical protein
MIMHIPLPPENDHDGIFCHPCLSFLQEVIEVCLSHRERDYSGPFLMFMSLVMAKTVSASTIIITIAIYP